MSQENYRSITLVTTGKNPQQKTNKSNLATYNGNYMLRPSEIYRGDLKLVAAYENQCNITLTEQRIRQHESQQIQ